MRIATVCGMGVGACVMLAVQVRAVLTDMGVDASVTPVAFDSLRGMDVDVAVAPRTMHGHLATTDIPVVLIDNLLDRAEIQAKLLAVAGPHSCG